MDEVVIESQIRAEEGNGIAQMDTEPFPCQKDSTLEPYQGMEFDSEESARSFYSSYARRVGFLVRISRYTRSRRDNSIISRVIVCSKEGFREPRRGDDLRQRRRAVTRVGCKAMLMVKKLAPGKWVVSKFVKEHNHGPVPPRKVEEVDLRVVRTEEDSAERSNFSSDGETHEPFEGMEFDSEEDARSFYIGYARRTGFRARISKYCRSRRDNSIISRQIVCSKEGFREVRIKKEETDDGRAKRPRVATRIGCKAMIVVKKLSSTGKWVVSRFEREHNHALGSKNVRSKDDCEKSLVTYVGTTNLDSQESSTVLYNHLCYEAIKYAREGAVSEDIYNVAMSALEEATEKVASAKRLAVHRGSDQSQRSNEYEKAVSGMELVSMQQPVGFVLIPSTSLAKDSIPSNIIDSPVILSMLNSQDRKISLKNLSLTAPSADDLVSNGNLDHDNAVQNSQKLDNNGFSHAKAAPGGGSNLSRPMISEVQMISVPAVPVTLYMPVAGSFSESSSVPMPGTPVSSNAYALVAAPVEAVSGSGHPKAEPGSQASTVQQYEGPNPQVHATAIAAGARVVPPQEAMSLIKAIEARVRTAKSALTSMPNRNSTNSQKALAVARAHEDNACEGLVAVHLHSPVEGSNEIDVGMISDPIANDDTCDD